MSFAAALADIEADLPRAVLIRGEGAWSRAASTSTCSRRRRGRRAVADATRASGAPGGAADPDRLAAHALCLTASFEISLACDLLLAAESAKFGLVERVVGLTPSMGGPQRLVERAGPARARELAYTGDLYDAATLERWNVVNRVLPDVGFDAAARAFALDLANGSTIAHGSTKRIVQATLAGGVAAADAIVPEVSGALFETEDLKAAVASFLEQGPGKASFRGH